MSFKTIIVFGSTGKQGSATIKALNAIGSYSIIAATRDTESDKAKALAQIPNIRVAKGEIGDHAHLFKDPVHGIFFFLIGFDIGASIERAKGMLDTAVSKGVQHVIFSGVDFCGHREKGIGHPFLDAKKPVEDYLMTLPLKWTIIRPTAIMENLYMPIYKDIITTTWVETIYYKWIASKDIGKIAAEIFEHPEKFSGKALNIAGDGMTPDEHVRMWKEVTGETLNAIKPPKFPPGLDSAMKFFDANECDADIEENRKNFPWLMDLKTWLKQSSFASQ